MNILDLQFNAILTMFRPMPLSGEGNKSLNYIFRLSVKQNCINFQRKVHNFNRF